MVDVVCSFHVEHECESFPFCCGPTAPPQLVFGLYCFQGISFPAFTSELADNNIKVIYVSGHQLIELSLPPKFRPARMPSHLTSPLPAFPYPSLPSGVIVLVLTVFWSLWRAVCLPPTEQGYRVPVVPLLADDPVVDS